VSTRSLAPRYGLQAAQAAQVRIGTSCARRAADTLGITSIEEARDHATVLFRSLVPSDFAHCEHMRADDGSVFYGDVYAKRDEITVWFIKFEFDGSATTVVLSCHEAEHPITLADGRTLRVR
jgi:hypothetical protein